LQCFCHYVMVSADCLISCLRHTLVCVRDVVVFLSSQLNWLLHIKSADPAEKDSCLWERSSCRRLSQDSPAIGQADQRHGWQTDERIISHLAHGFGARVLDGSFVVLLYQQGTEG